jgi:nitrite reductase/ring-hydroxylating ferredoxin subunit
MGFRSFIKRKVEQRIRGDAAPAAAPTSQPLPTAPDSDGYVAVSHATAISVGAGRTVVVHGAPVAVFHTESGWYAIDDACTHEDAPLGEGALDGDVVICPYHDWRYDLKTGACHTDPARPVGCFAVRVTDGIVWVGPRTSEGTTERGGDHDDGLKTTEPLR